MTTSSASSFLRSEITSNRAVTLICKEAESSIHLLGTTVPANVQTESGHQSGHRSITFYLEKGQEGLIAVNINGYIGKNKDGYGRHANLPVFLKVGWKEGAEGLHPWIDLDKSWFPDERVGCVTEYSVEVDVSGAHFTTYSSSNEENLSKGVHLLPDGNLLCRYLWGISSKLDLLHTAVAKKFELSAIKRAKMLTNEVQLLMHENNYLKDKVADLFEGGRESDAAWRRQLSGLLESMEPLYYRLVRRPKWLRSESIEKFITAMEAAEV